MLTFLRLSQGRVEEVTSLLSEVIGTPLTTEMTCTWHPASFIPIIEKHNARLAQAHLLHTATRLTIEQKWAEGVTLKDIGKFLYSWAPEPYRNKPMPQGMVQALLLIGPDSQTWNPRDLSNCIIRNAAAFQLCYPVRSCY